MCVGGVGAECGDLIDQEVSGAGVAGSGSSSCGAVPVFYQKKRKPGVDYISQRAPGRRSMVLEERYGGPVTLLSPSLCPLRPEYSCEEKFMELLHWADFFLNSTFISNLLTL